MAAALDVLGIGNAIVDVLARADDAFLARHKAAKGSMNLIDAARADSLYRDMGPGVECSGGSAANTIAGLASLGAKAGYVGKVRDDQLGQVFAHDIRALGVAFTTPPAKSGPSTARCLVHVTPDGQRTMHTYLGACVELGPDDVDPDQVAQAQVTYLEGYLWDPPRAKEAFRKAIRAAKAAGRKTSLSLSDGFCVDRYRREFLELANGEIDILFANEAEILSLFEAKSFDEALQEARKLPGIVALTRSEKGSVVVNAKGDEVHVVDAAPIKQLIDTTGAGDLYAAGFLFGFTRGRALAECARLGGLCAGAIIQQMGARPQVALREALQGQLG
ncbi:adenosine kinase [Desertibaculum subflavum]|uniref:adenosine kinase n=1 Tax=Desertibaculum subflavum TaxID=2268458 RepID=UPI000E66C7C5